MAHMADMRAYSDWGHEFITGDPGPNRCDTIFVFEPLQYETARRLPR